MKRRRLGVTGVEVSAIGLGTNNIGWRLDRSGAKRLIDACSDLGIDFIDTADVYGEGASESYLGEALRGRRDRFFIATKVGMPWEDGSQPGGLSPAYLRRAVRDSLRRLGTDRVDLLQLHRPDPSVNIVDTLEALSSMVDDGLIRHVGVSNFMAWELAQVVLESRHHGLTPPVSIQTEFSMLVRDAETELVHAAREFDVSLIPHRPLAQGFLTGKYHRSGELPSGARLTVQEQARSRRFTRGNFDALDELTIIAEDEGCSVGQLALAWLLTHDVVASVIAGASDVAQLTENAAAGSITLAADTRARIDEALPPIPGGAVGALGNR